MTILLNVGFLLYSRLKVQNKVLKPYFLNLSSVENVCRSIPNLINLLFFN